MKNGKLSIGNNVLLGKNLEIDYSGEVIIEDYVWLSDGCMIYTHDHSLEAKMRNDCYGEHVFTNKLICREGCWIGAKSIILPSVSVIGKHSVVGAGSIVTKDVEDYVIVAGNPAKVVKRLPGGMKSLYYD
jgi:acetyltransferase-like isoleucine patch superfamily enzyme